ncbi:MAG: dienelactone hydrolase family protein [Acidobacteria bacterium]|nr:dienelactone hydrolase family protein [Acidobacteriota bacterium]
MDRKKASDFDPALLQLFDEYVHGGLSRREFVDRASRYAVGGVTAAALVESLSPTYAWAQQVPPDDARIQAEYVTYPSPQGHGSMRGLLARPTTGDGKWPGVLVVHENRGLNPYIEDVTRRLAVAGFLAFGPDALTPVGGYPGDDDKGRELQATLDRVKVMEDFVAAAEFLKTHPQCTGRIGVVGFCFGGLVANTLAVRLPELAAAVPFYGSQAPTADVPKIRAKLLIHYASNDERVNAGWPAYEAALKAHGVSYETHFYPETNHGFHNDTTPRYDEAAAKLAWQRTLDFFNQTLR